MFFAVTTCILFVVPLFCVFAVGHSVAYAVDLLVSLFLLFVWRVVAVFLVIVIFVY